MPAERCSVYELRQYTLRPGSRDAFVELFDRELVGPQEEVGMRVVGHFRDLDRPDVFVWIRGFADMTTRLDGLTAFYDGPVWAAHRGVANPMMLDSDDVLLLRPVGEGRPFGGGAPRPPLGNVEEADPLVAVTIYPLGPNGAEQFEDFYGRVLKPVLDHTGGSPVAALATNDATNTFPRLPVREDERVFVIVTRFPNRAGHAAHLRELAADGTWQRLLPRLRGLTSGPAQSLRLRPAPRSALR